MQPVVPLLLLLHPDRALAARLRELPGSPFRFVRVPDWTALRNEVRRAPANAVAVVDPGSGHDDAEHAAPLRALLHDFPSFTVVAALPVGPDGADRLRALFASGVADVLALNRETTPAALARRLRVVQGRRIQRLLQRALPRGAPSRSRALLTRAAEVAAVGGKAPELAASLGVSERSVPRWCHRADLPPPRRLLAWLRLLLAADLLDDRGRSVASAARACGYANEMTLRTACIRFVGQTPVALREGGAFDTLGRAFATELFTLREAARDRGRPESVWLL